MRHEVAVALILCGTALAVTPPASDYLNQRQITQVLIQREDFSNVSSGIAPMSQQYRLGCWGLGAAMIAIAIWHSRNVYDRPDE